MNAQIKQAMLTMLGVNHLENNHFQDHLNFYHTEGWTVNMMSVLNKEE